MSAIRSHSAQSRFVMEMVACIIPIGQSFQFHADKCRRLARKGCVELSGRKVEDGRYDIEPIGADN
jgi:hypothetical protein